MSNNFFIILADRCGDIYHISLTLILSLPTPRLRQAGPQGRGRNTNGNTNAKENVNREDINRKSTNCKLVKFLSISFFLIFEVCYSLYKESR